MELYKKDVIQKIVAMLLVLVITIAQFALVGTSAITYAIDMIATNNGNVEFCAYFVNENGEEVTTINNSINAENLKLKIDVAVKNEGYFNGQISLGDASFKLKNEVSSKYVSKIENNIVYLNQINAGTTATIELGIEYNRSTIKIEKASLNKECKINLTGTYVNSQNSVDINGKSAVSINWVSPSDISAQLAAKVLTNSVYKIGEENKRIVQILVGSKVENNAYPVKNTKIEMSVPNGVEEVAVHKRTTSATNGDDEFTTNNYQYSAETGILTINISNNEDQDGKIDWAENAQDILVVTYKYPENIDLTNQEIIVNGTITTYDEKELKEQAKATIQEEIDGIVTNGLTTTKEIYKGNIYISKERDYETATAINVDFALALENIQIKENKPSFVAGNEEKVANIQYKQTIINRNEFIKIFGEDGYITIQDQNGNVLANITKDSQTDEYGNIIVNYASGVTALTIKTSTPTTNGILNIEHKKTILSTGYSRKEIRNLTGVKESTEVKYTKMDQSTNSVKQTKEMALIETQSFATISTETNTLSATGENTLLKMQVVLESNNEKQDVYKNPVVKIIFPEEINVVAATINPAYNTGLEILNKTLTEENGKQVLMIELKGEQTDYLSYAEKGITLSIDLMANVSELTISSEKDIIVNYTNENAISYANNGEQKIKMKILNEKSIITTNDIAEYNVQTIGKEETKEIELETGKAQDATIDMKVINNEGSRISDVIILGKIPTLSQDKTSIKLTTQLNITSNTSDVAIYYTDVENPTSDIQNAENKWTNEQSEYSKYYLIVIEDMENGEQFSANYKLNIYAQTQNLRLEEGYIVSYTNSVADTSKTAKSTNIVLITDENISGIKEAILAKVGEDSLANGDEVKAGEIIDYTIALQNSKDTDVTGLNIIANIPDSMTYIEYNIPEYKEEVEGASYTDLYTEKQDVKEKVFSNVTIPAGKTITLNYSVKVNEQVTDGDQVIVTISTKNDLIDISQNIEHTLKSAEIVATIAKGLREGDETLSIGRIYDYVVKVKNISSSDKQNINLTLNKNDLLELSIMEDENIIQEESFNIATLASGEEKTFYVYMKVKSPTQTESQATISGIVKDNGTTYRVNKITEDVEKIGISLNLTSNTETAYIESNQEFTYTINVENTGEENIETLYIKDEFISQYLELQSVTLNGEKCEYTESSITMGDIETTYIEIETPIKSEEQISIEIRVKVKSDVELLEETEIINAVEVLKEESLATAQIKHYMKAYTIDDGDIDDDWNDGDITGDDNDNPGEENPGEENPGEENPGEENPGEGNPGDENPGDENQTETNKYSITGVVWLDSNENGRRDSSETLLKDIDVMLLDITNNQIAKDTDGINISAKTDNNGEYTLSNIPEGKYIVAFEYDTGKYIVTSYQSEKADETKNSDAITNKLIINGQEKSVAATDTMNITKNIENIDLGLVESKVFDLELEKCVTKIVISNGQGTKTYNYDDESLAKVEIAAKYLSGTNVVIEYKIKVTNKGEVAGYAQDIVDYFPSSLKFSSSLNPDWYQSGEYVHNSSLSDVKIEPGETKELKLIATKTMTESNTGLVNNKAEIQKAYNSSGIADIDSTPENQESKEDDLGSVDVIITIKTGQAVTYILLIITIIGTIVVIAYVVNKKLLEIER